MTRTLAGLLREHPLFAELGEPGLSLLADCGRNEVFGEGDLLAREGGPADAVYLLQSGVARVEVHVPGRGDVGLQTVTGGDVVGWSWIFPPYEWSFTVRALGELHAVRFDGRCLRRKCEEDPALGFALMKRMALVLSERLKATRLQLLDVYGSTH